MDARRRRFAVALTAFVAWVGALVALVAVSSRKPQARPEAAAEAPEAPR